MPSQGGGANRAGRRLEAWVDDILDERKYKKVIQREFAVRKQHGNPIYATQCVVGKDIYGKNRRVDAILFHPELFPKCLVLQCKWQASGGSVDQKYPFEVLSIKESELETIIVLDGGGYSEGARDWLLKQVGQNFLKAVFTQAEFSRFARDHLSL